MAQNSSLLNTVPVEDLSVCNAPLPHATPEFGDTTIIAHLLSPQLQCSSKPDLAEMTSTSGPSIPTVHSDLPSHSIALLLQNISHLHARLSSAEVSARSWQAGFMALQSPARTIPSVTPLYLCSPSSSSSTSTKDLCSRCDAELGSAHNAIHDRYQSMVTVALQARRAAHDFKQLARYWERRARKTEAQFGKASDTSITPSASDVSEVSTSEILDPIRTQAVRELLARRAAAAPVDGNSDTTDLGPNFVQSAVEDHLARVQAAISPIPDSGSASSSSTVHALEDTALTLETKKQDALQADAQSLVPDTPSVVGTQHPNPIPALHPPPNKSTRRATSTRAHAGCIAPSALKTPKKVVTQRSHSEHVVKAAGPQPRAPVLRARNCSESSSRISTAATSNTGSASSSPHFGRVRAASSSSARCAPQKHSVIGGRARVASLRAVPPLPASPTASPVTARTAVSTRSTLSAPLRKSSNFGSVPVPT